MAFPDAEDGRTVAAGMVTSSALVSWALSNWEILWWSGWIIAFLAVELPAVFNAKLGDTFSETWWRWLHIKGGPRPMPDGGTKVVKPLPLWAVIPIRVAIVAFGVWLIGHLGFGFWGGE